MSLSEIKLFRLIGDIEAHVLSARETDLLDEFFFQNRECHRKKSRSSGVPVPRHGSRMDVMAPPRTIHMKLVTTEPS